MKKRLPFIVAVLCCSLVLGACANNRNNTQKDPSGTSIDTVKSKLDILQPVAYSSVEGLSLEPGSYISIIGRYSGDSYWKEVEAGAKQAVEELNNLLGYKGKDKIELVYTAPEVRDDVPKATFRLLPLIQEVIINTLIHMLQQIILLLHKLLLHN